MGVCGGGGGEGGWLTGGFGVTTEWAQHSVEWNEMSAVPLVKHQQSRSAVGHVYRLYLLYSWAIWVCLCLFIAPWITVRPVAFCPSYQWYHRTTPISISSILRPAFGWNWCITAVTVQREWYLGHSLFLSQVDLPLCTKPRTWAAVKTTPSRWDTTLFR